MKPEQRYEDLSSTGKLRLVPWDDESLDPYGHDPRSAYVEQFWLSVLGPSTTWFLRICASKLDTRRDATVDIAEMARAIGIGHRGGRNSAMARTIVRACKFHAARPMGRNSLGVRRRLPPLQHHQLRRLPKSLRRLHEEYIATDAANDCVSERRQRARRLALGLVECGDTPDSAEMQLGLWHFQPSVAADAVRWAWKQYNQLCPQPVTATA